MRTGSLVQDIPPASPAEAFDSLVVRGGVRIERIVSRGHASPPGFWFDQDENEYVVLLTGRAELEFDGGLRVPLGPFDWVDIAAHERHRVAWTAPDEDTVWLAVFYPGW